MRPPTATTDRPLSMVKLLILAACALLLVPGAAAASPAQPAEDDPYQDVELQARTNLLVNDEGFNLPPGSSFTSTTPDINNNAEVAFRVQQVADPSPTDMQGGVWLGGQGEGEIVHLTGDLDPGDVGMNNDGDFAFSASEGLGASSLYLYEVEEGEANEVVLAPVYPATVSSPEVNDGGDIGFQGEVTPGRFLGVYDTSDEELQMYLEPGEHSWVYTPGFNNVGQIASKISTESNTHDGIYLYDGDDETELLVNDTIDPESDYTDFDNTVSVNDDGAVAAIARRAEDGVRTVIRIDAPGEVTEVAEISEDGPIFDLHFFPPDINNDGQVAFRADDENGQAVYVGDGDEVTRVVGDGDVVETDNGTGQLGQHDESPVFGGAPSINDHGDIVFTAGLHPEGDDQVEWGTGVMVAYSGIEQDPVVESVAVDPAEASVEVGGTVDLTATAHYDDGSSDDVTDVADWTSDDPDVATVDDAGLVTGVADGDTDVTASFDGESDAAAITVTDDDEVPPPGDPVDLVVSPDESTIGVGGVVQLEATAIYEDGGEQPVTEEADWVSGDPEVATVDDEGLVVGVAEGDTEVTATFEDLSDSASVTVDAEVEPGPVGLERISAEPGRVEVAIAASEHRFGDGEASAVVLARADEYPDALAGTTLAAEVDAPLLLTSSDQLLDNVADEIARALSDDGQVYLAGGTAALDDSVEDAVDDLGYDLTRLGGQTRFETAGLIADELGERSQVLVTTGLDFPDALTAGAAAAAHDGVVLLSADEEPHEVVDDYLDEFDGEVTAVGGPATRAYPDAEAVMGQTRDETAVAVAEAFFDEPTAFGVARRDDYPDALAGGAHIAAYEGPLLLSYTDQVPDETAEWLQATEATGGFVYGGTAAIDEDTFDELEDLTFGEDNDNNNDDGE